jgi:Dyp-type peroxidase family
MATAPPQQPVPAPPTTTPAPLDLNNIQGDVLDGLPKKAETFVFFRIIDKDGFKQSFKRVIPLITTVTDVRNDRDTISHHKSQGSQNVIPIVGTNVAFSQQGLYTLGILDDLHDDFFRDGQLSDASKNSTNGGIADPGTPITSPSDGRTIDPAWERRFKQQIDGLFLVTGNGSLGINARILEIELLLLGTIQVLFQEHGHVRPGAEKGHEPFGFKDCISNPPVIGARAPGPDEEPTLPGVILIGREGDDQLPPATGAKGRPAWAKDSSFLVFRKLRQKVPEFNNFLTNNPIKAPGLSAADGSELLGARLVGRWKSGAPIDRDPTADNLADAADVNKINDFNYTDDLTTGVRCPFTAHLRKTNPRRGNFPGVANVQPRRIIRHGIPYGHEVTQAEKDAGVTTNDRGLLFVCYQSDISLGFHFVQQSWANNPKFPTVPFPPVTGTTPLTVGFDAIIGQNGNDSRFILGTDPNNLTSSLTLPAGKDAWVVPLGGEYFISPSISALKTKFVS